MLPLTIMWAWVLNHTKLPTQESNTGDTKHATLYREQVHIIIRKHFLQDWHLCIHYLMRSGTEDIKRLTLLHTRVTCKFRYLSFNESIVYCWVKHTLQHRPTRMRLPRQTEANKTPVLKSRLVTFTLDKFRVKATNGLHAGKTELSM